MIKNVLAKVQNTVALKVKYFITLVCGFDNIFSAFRMRIGDE
jgi:hypothetical protein